MILDVNRVRADFECLAIPLNGLPPVYFDNACMTLKPKPVLDVMLDYYRHNPSCHNRASHKFGEATTKQYDHARRIIQKHINAESSSEVIFTRNTTEALNLVAHGIALTSGDTILTSDMEHNSNLLPWQALRKRGINHLTFPIRPNANFEDLDGFENTIRTKNVKVVSTFYISNVTGISLPIKEMASLAHKHGALFVLDAAQALPHCQLDVRDCEIDYMAISFHKAFGPTGIGALFGRRKLLLNWEPLMRGGETVEDVTFDNHTLSDLPFRLEPGLQDYAGAIGAARALQYISALGFDRIRDHELKLNNLLTAKLSELPGVRILGPQSAQQRGSIVNFLLKNVDAREAALLLDRTANFMTRGGVHCCHAWYHRYDVPPSLRVSLSIYNTEHEIELFVNTLAKIVRYF